ncbi:MAG TPA: TolC family protein [Verrucomicrobiae bacterium]|jgi:outer membrane protein TolC
MRAHTLLPWVFAVAYALAVGPLSAAESRAITLNDCIEMALKRNLDIQIERYNPEIAVNNVNIALAGYEPNFTVSGQHNFSLTGGGAFNPTTGTFQIGSQSDADSFSTDLKGVTPFWGLSYDAFGNVRESTGFSSTNLFDNSSGAIGITLTQPLLKNFWVDPTRYNIQISRNRLRFSESQLRDRVMTVVTAVEDAYYELIFSRESVKVQEKALQLAERLLSENKKRVEVGALAPLDEKQAESQVAARRADLLVAQRTLSTAENALKKLISDDYTTLHGTALDPTDPLGAVEQPIELQESWHKGLALRPDLAQVRLDIERAGIDVRYTKNQALPELNLLGQYGHARSVAAGEFSDAFDSFRRGDQPFYYYGAQLIVPLGNAAARNKYRNSKLATEQVLLIAKKLEQDILVQIDDAVKLARTSFERVDATKQARLYAEAALEAEQKKLENGKSTSFVVLQLQRDLTAARSDEIRALADYNKALTDLSRSEGSTLERRKIDLEVK